MGTRVGAVQRASYQEPRVNTDFVSLCELTMTLEKAFP
jgi:hypothetical protein